MPITKSEDNISIKNIIKQVEKNIFLPVYLFYGNEQYIIDETVSKIINKVIEPSLQQLNVEKYYCSDTDSETIVASALSVPMLSEKKVVIVRDYDKINDSKALRYYFESPPQSTILILISNSIDKRKSIFSLISKSGGVLIKCENLKRDELSLWVKNKIHSYGKDIKDSAIDILFDLKGDSLQDVYTEIEKIITFVNDKEIIEDNDIFSIIGSTKELNVFELSKLIVLGKKNKALIMLNKLIDQNTEPLLIVNLLARHFILLWKIQNLKIVNKNPSEIALIIQLNPYFANDYISQSEKFNSIKLEKCISFLKETDIQLKSVTLPKKIILDNLICNLINPITI
jgi:DNA polymerase-3 subunit delta